MSEEQESYDDLPWNDTEGTTIKQLNNDDTTIKQLYSDNTAIKQFDSISKPKKPAKTKEVYKRPDEPIINNPNITKDLASVKYDYCNKCGNTRTLANGNPCDCTVTEFSNIYEFDTNTCTVIPEQYAGITFNVNKVKGYMSDYYTSYLKKTYLDITSQKFKFLNIMLISPPSTSKTIWAYSIMETLYRTGNDVAPLLDLHEIKKVNMSTSALYEDLNIDVIYRVPYLFVRIPLDLSSYSFASIETLVDRRVRKGGSTIFLYSGNLASLKVIDKYNMIEKMSGDGSFKSIKIEQFAGGAH